MFAAELPSSPTLFGRALHRLGVQPRLFLRSAVPGVFGLTTADDSGQRLVHLLNITGCTPTVQVGWHGAPSRTLTLPPRAGVALPLGLVTPLGVIETADADLVEVTTGVLRFGPGLAGADSEVRLRGRLSSAEGGVLTVVDDLCVVRGPGPFVLHR